LNLEHHYWIKESILDKIGRMAPNLQELSLRRMKLSSKAFTAIACELKKLKKIDVSDCHLIESSALTVLLDNNHGLEQVQFNNCP